MSDCIFCRISAGDAEASVVYEDSATLAFMNQRQASAGHVLVIPRAHVPTIYGLTPELAARLFQTVVRTARALERQLQPAGLSVWQSNGEAAGQDVFHVHVHVFPRQPQDGFLRFYPETPQTRDRAHLDELAAVIRPGFTDFQ